MFKVRAVEDWQKNVFKIVTVENADVVVKLSSEHEKKAWIKAIT